MVGGTDQTSTGRDRYQGYVNALKKANIPVDPALRIAGPRSKQGGFEAAVHFLSLPQKPTAAAATPVPTCCPCWSHVSTTWCTAWVSAPPALKRASWCRTRP